MKRRLQRFCSAHCISVGRTECKSEGDVSLSQTQAVTFILGDKKAAKSTKKTHTPLLSPSPDTHTVAGCSHMCNSSEAQSADYISAALRGGGVQLK